ncbi:MAG TPA: hypothetical protein VGM46_08505 [Mesorhizobium sp.]|jgi:pyridoxine/pyridoxamine 5'-phosphate oxidase
MTHQDYSARAELYLGSDRATAFAQGPRAFRTAAHAIRFAIEEAAPVSLRGARLVTNNATFWGDDLVRLHNSPDYPLPRRRAASARKKRN